MIRSAAFTLGSDITFQYRIRHEAAFTAIPDKTHAGAEGACDLVGVQLGLAHIVVAQHFCGEILFHQAGQNTHFHFGGSICGKLKVCFGQTLVIAQIEKVSGIDAGFPQLKACHMQKVADIERDLQTMDALVLVGGDKQQAFVHQIFFVQRRTGKTMDSASFFVMVDSALLCVFCKIKGTPTTPWCCPMSLATDFIVVRQPQAPTSCISFGFYRCPPTSGPYVLHLIGF